MHDFHRLLARHHSWLKGRVHYRARAWGLKEMADDLLQETLVIATERAPRFFAGPSRNVDARMRCLLLESLRSAATNLYRQMKKTPLAGGELPERSEVEDPESLLAAAEYRAEHLALARATLSPNVALTHLCAYFPGEVGLEDFERAASFRAGGAQGLARPVDETWRLFRRLREERLARTSEAEWKRLLVELFRSTAPLGEAAPELVERGIRNFDTQLTRARAKLGLAVPGTSKQGRFR